jgi:hypothetical protein
MQDDPQTVVDAYTQFLEIGDEAEDEEVTMEEI